MRSMDHHTQPKNDFFRLARLADKRRRALHGHRIAILSRPPARNTKTHRIDLTRHTGYDFLRQVAQSRLDDQEITHHVVLLESRTIKLAQMALLFGANGLVLTDDVDGKTAVRLVLETQNEPFQANSSFEEVKQKETQQWIDACRPQSRYLSP